MNTTAARSRTAFVLAGGGSLGAVQVGMLKALARHDIVPDLVVGASVGAINGAYYAGEPNIGGVAGLERIWRRLTRSDLFPFLSFNGLLSLLGSRGYFVTPARLRSLLESELLHFRLEDSPVPCHVVATDVLSGEEVVLSTGPTVTALLASAAIPAVFPTVTVDGRYLMDGGVANNTPISTAIRLGARKIVVLPTGMSCAIEAPPRGAMSIAMHALNLVIMQQLDRDVERFAGQAQIIMVPPLCPLTVTPYDFSQSAELIRRAEASTRLWLKQGGLEGKVAMHEPLAHHDRPDGAPADAAGIRLELAPAPGASLPRPVRDRPHARTAAAASVRGDR